MPSGRDRPDPRPFLRSIWRRRWLLGGLIVTIPLLVFVVSSLLPEEYEASATLQARTSGLEAPSLSGENPFPPPSAQEAARLVETTTVAGKAAAELDEPPTENRLLEDVTATASADQSSGPTQVFTITARSGDPDRAADIANAFASGVTALLVEQAIASIDDTIESLQSRADTDTRASRRSLDRALQELESLRASRPSSLQVIERATPPQDPVAPRPLRNTTLALIFSTLLAGALVPLLDRLDRKVHQPGELDDLTGARVLAEVPGSTAGEIAVSDPAREAYQTLRTGLMYFNVDRSVRSLMITSPGPAEGKTTVAVNLAIAMARAEMDVVLLDADLRRRPIAGHMGASGRHGLGSVLLGEAESEDALEPVDTERGSLRVMSGGTPVLDPAVLLGSQRMKDLLEDLEGEADVVIVDTPPILAVSDAVPLLARVSGVLLVGRLEHTTRDAFWRAAHVIESAEGSLLGVVATDVPDELRDAGYGGYYVSDGASSGSPTAERPSNSS